MKYFSYLSFLVIIILCSSTSTFSKDIITNQNLKNNSNLVRTVPNQIYIRLRQNLETEKVLEKILSNAKISIERSLLKKDESIIYNESLRKKASLQKNLKIESIKKAEEPLLRTFVINFNSELTPESFCNYILAKYPEIELAELIFIYKIQDLPDDYYAGQQNLLSSCDIVAAWQIEEGDSNVVIGISDNGVDQNHEDLRNSIAINWADPLNGIDDDKNGYIDDFRGFDLTGENSVPDNTYASNDHGTNVAGIAAATVNNGFGIAGVANKSRFFPIKISKNNELVNGYESFKYAAKRGFKVMNCSWGLEKTYSDLDQSLINYAVAYDVAIVASGGNSSGSLLKNYPSAYKNVFAVGEVDQVDNFSGNNIGDFLDILAPGGGNWYTGNNNRYSNSGHGSSYSAPVISGIVALVRSKYPELSGLQAIELVRQSTRKVTSRPSNSLWKDILPGKVNAYLAVTTDPFSIPSIRPEKVYFKDKTGNINSRFSIADTGFIEIDAYNYLGEISDVTIKLSAVWDEEGSIAIVDSILYIPKVNRESAINLKGFSFTKIGEYRQKMFFRFDISGPNDYSDFFLVEYFPTPVVTTFKNKSISFSASDRGTIGTGGEENNSQGIGFIYKDKGNQLWKSCFLASDLMESFVSSLYWDQYASDANDFVAVKELVPPTTNIGIFNDSKASPSTRIGFEVKQEFIVPSGYQSIVKVNIEIKNIMSPNIPDLSSGYYFDWDLMNSDSNIVSLVADAIPTHLKMYPSAVQMVQYAGGNHPVVGCGVISFEPEAVVQSAGLNNYIHSVYDDANALDITRQGTSMQDIGVTDVSTFVGMLFEGNLPKNATKKYSICFGGADNEVEFIESMQLAMDTTYSGIDEIAVLNTNVIIYPNPTAEIINCEITTSKATTIEISICDLIGNTIITENRILNYPGKLLMSFDSKHLTSGNYIMITKLNNKTITKQITIIK